MGNERVVFMYEGNDLMAKDMKKRLWEFKLNTYAHEAEVLFEKKTLEKCYLAISVSLSEKALLPVLEKSELKEEELVHEMRAEINNFSQIYDYCRKK